MGPQKLLTNILEPFSETIGDLFNGWLAEQGKLARTLAPEQMGWLIMVKDNIASSVSISMEDFENVPFNQKDGAIKSVPTIWQCIG